MRLARVDLTQEEPRLTPALLRADVTRNGEARLQDLGRVGDGGGEELLEVLVLGELLVLGSAPLGKWRKLDELGEGPIRLELKKNGETVQKADSSEMIFSIDAVISYVSQFMTLKIGDLIFTGTPSGVGPVAIGDKLEGYLNDEQLLRLAIK